MSNSAIEALLQHRKRWQQYVTQPPVQPVGQSGTAVSTVAGSGLPAVALRSTEAFRQDTAKNVDLLLDEVLRHRHWLQRLEAGPTPVPLVLPDDVEADLRHLHEDVVDLCTRVRGEDGLHARVVRLEYHQEQPGEAVSGWVAALAVAGAAISALGALVAVGSLLWVGGLLRSPEAGPGNGSPSGVVAPIGATTDADGASQVGEAVGRKNERAGREGP